LNIPKNKNVRLDSISVASFRYIGHLERGVSSRTYSLRETTSNHEAGSQSTTPVTIYILSTLVSWRKAQAWPRTFLHVENMSWNWHRVQDGRCSEKKRRRYYRGGHFCFSVCSSTCYSKVVTVCKWRTYSGTGSLLLFNTLLETNFQSLVWL